MQGVQLRLGMQSQGDSTLVGDNDHLASGAIELRDRLLDTGEDFKFFPGSDVGADERPVEDAVPI